MSNFKPRARLLLQLGDQLIKNESIAILELVKNAYDADASYVKIKMENLNDSNGTITIRDDGIGMDSEIINNVWLKPGSDYKAKILEKKQYSKKHRLPLGEKGIGRFSAHKLGNNITLISRMRDKQEVKIVINWNDVNKYEYLEEFPVKVIERKPKIFTGNKKGTLIKITELRNDQWSSQVIKELYRSINAFSSPFITNDSFRVIFNIDQKEIIEKIPDVVTIKELALYKFRLVLKGNQISSFYYSFKPYLGMDKLSPRSLFYNYRNKNNLEKEFKIIKNMVKKPLRSSKKGIKESLPIWLDERDIKIGEIIFEGWIYDRSPKVLKYAETDSRALRTYLNENGGVRIYRDGIRVYDYGEPENDWLGLEKKRLYDPGIKLNKSLLLAAVHLNRESSESLIEKTNREGFIENDAYRNLRDAIGYAIYIVENFRNEDKDNVRLYYGLSPRGEPVLESIDDLREYIDNRIKDEIIRKQCIYKLEKIESDYKSINEILLISAEAGLNYSVALHEIEKITIELKKVIKSERASSRIIKLIEHLSELIEMYAIALRRSKRKEESLKDLISDSLFHVHYRLKAHEIEIISHYSKFRGKDRIICSPRLIMGSITNIIDNSIYWLERANIKNKKILISLTSKTSGFLELIIADNGNGFALLPEQMIKPFVSLKPGGIGLGLHIVNEAMNSHQGRLEFLNPLEKGLPKEFANGATIGLIIKKLQRDE